MSTRATYRFTGQYTGRHAFYIHYDGYPEGAAEYFWAMHHFEGRGSAADHFIRANDLAELTGGHDAHGDTEYRYDFEQDTGLLTAYKRIYGQGREQDTWDLIFTGHYTEFINKYADHPEIHKIKDVQWDKSVRYCYLTREQAEALLAKKQGYLDEYRAKFPDAAGNIGSIESDVARLQGFVNQVLAAEGVKPCT